ncbi:MAG TPA: DUF5665 domain-containing protein [Gammaproteobacteria bacterium]|nr:DUF5665 domain-containing protein [Gammaproteobacteria bacterium]
MGTDHHNDIHRSRKKMLLDNFVGGIAWGFGTVIGGTLVILLIGYILSKVELIPIIGDWMHAITQEVQRHTIKN